MDASVGLITWLYNGTVSDDKIRRAESRAEDRERTLVRSSDLWWAAVAATLIPAGLIWDFSWEATIGVDRFWSPPHLTIHIGIWLSGILGARLILATLIARHRGVPAAGVNVAGLCGPVGAWILLWGAAAMLAAFLFDNWWQQVYGLGAGLWHPPQILKTIGFFALLLGGTALCTGTRSNRGETSGTSEALLVWHGGLLLAMCALVLTMQNYPNWQHTGSFYLISSAIYPAVLLMAGRASPARWGATRAAIAYTLLAGVMVWSLPLFPARPLAAPIRNPTDHMMPPPFPLLLVIPAIVIDSLRARFTPGESARREFRLAGALGIVFVGVFVPVQWSFARFLLSPMSDNWFFAGGGRHWPYFLKIDQARVMFWDLKQDPLTWRAVSLAILFATASTWMGLRMGAWLGKLRR